MEEKTMASSGQEGYRIAAEAFATFSAAAGATLGELSNYYPGLLDEFLDSLRDKIGTPQQSSSAEEAARSMSSQLTLSELHRRFEASARMARDATS